MIKDLYLKPTCVSIRLLSLGIISRQKQNLLWLMIICCASCQITGSENQIQIKVQVNSTDHCFWNQSISPYSALSYDNLENCHIMNVTLNISSQGQCRSYSFTITKQGEDYEIRMNETIEGIKLCLLVNDDCLPSAQQEVVPVFMSLEEQIRRGSSSHENDNIFNCPLVGSSISAINYMEESCFATVVPEEKCTNADDDICNEEEVSKFILRLKNSEWMCVTCDNSDLGEGVEAAEASDYLDKMESNMEEMEKKHTSIQNVKGEAIGLLQIHAENTTTEDTCYSSNQNKINVVDCQSIPNTNFSWAVKIPKEAVNKSRQENSGHAFVAVLQFKNMRDKNQTKNQTVLNNEVYGITMRANISNLTDNIEMLFAHNDEVSNVSCVSWAGKGELNWTTFGCETEINNNTIKCSCSHLTFFAVLMSQSYANITAKDLESLTYITYIGCGISMFFLSIALFMHFLLRKAKSNQATKILMNMFVALFLLNASFLSNESVANTQDNAACVFIALLLHYSMLASFTWFFIQALHMYLWLIRQNVTIRNYTRKITVLGWVCPAPIVTVIVSVGGYEAVIINATSGKITRMCWITNRYIHYTVNIGYYALVFIFTTGIFIMIVTKVVQTRNTKATDGKRKTFRKQLMMMLSLFVLFGLTWSVAFFSYGPMLIPSYYIFTVLNSFQGFFLFLYYYHIHNDVADHFSDDPESTDSTTTIAQSNITAVENIYN
ncbi:adhesion G-protein coupled receptor G5-like isoform X1 [Onychostoma macrolepis]|uniref:adhesion G-protein coupled receptor G5-like isoform X1 n=1 Tax=Onychostoma macrolepis TaxID=369639 RepID=UPI00272AFDA2|nr:adhesion G-protein coupled receptor G5-like isoform X1 [Onychostoma macrolepis]